MAVLRQSCSQRVDVGAVVSDGKKAFRIKAEIASGFYESAVQAGVVRSGLPVHQGLGDSPSALEDPVIVTVHRDRDTWLAVDADPPRLMAPSGMTYIVTLEARTARAVVLRAARLVVLSRRLPRPSCREATFGFIGSRPPDRYFETNLDRTDPLPGRTGPLPGFDADSPQLHPVGPDFPFTISATDVEQFRFKAITHTDEVCWQVELDWICAGREGTVVINDNGRPFETYPLAARETDLGRWALQTACGGHRCLRGERDRSDCPRIRLTDNSTVAPSAWSQSIGFQDVIRTTLALGASGQDADPDEPATWPAYQQLAVYARTLLGQQRFHSHESEPFRALLVRVTRFFFMSGQSRLGVQIAGPVHRDWETHLGEDHPHTLALANRLAGCLYGMRDFDQARLLQARVLWESILPRFRKTFGTMHADTLTVTSNLAMALGHLGELETAENLAGDALRMSTQALGNDHLTTRRAQGIVRALATLRENSRDS